ncbi:MAG: hypothetical protein PVF19_03815 [Gemmatimonadota bacterium]|jgi:hypothetical protein
MTASSQRIAGVDIFPVMDEQKPLSQITPEDVESRGIERRTFLGRFGAMAALSGLLGYTVGCESASCDSDVGDEPSADSDGADEPVVDQDFSDYCATEKD